MEREEQKRSAEKFIDITLQLSLVPPDDQTLPNEYFTERRKRILNDKDHECLNELKELLDKAPISLYMKRQLAHEQLLEHATGVINKNPIEEGAGMLGIRLDKDEYGFFDEKKALIIERFYFFSIKPLLQMRERQGIENPVNWQDWELHLTSQS